jgi:hypothetical protein
MTVISNQSNIKNQNKMNIINYIPRDTKGRFTNFRKKMLKLIVYQLIVLSVVMNCYQAKQHYNIRCGVDGQTIGGWFPTKEQCNDLASLKQDSQELGRLQALANNQDLR